MIFDIDEVEEKLGYSFKDKILLRQCFTHSSYANEHGELNNEILEFYGDSIMEFIVTEYLVKNSKGDEGALTQKRAEMVSKKPLLVAVKKLGLVEHVLLARGLQNNFNSDDKLFSSVYEAVVAGIYVDGGLKEAKKFIERTIISDYENAQKLKKKDTSAGDAKNQFQEYVQKKKLGSIRYEQLWKKGPDHKPEFRVVALLNGARIAEGSGASKKIAEGKAAESALKKIIKQEGKRK